MFLTTKWILKGVKSERGSALLAAIGVTAVSGIVAVTMTTMSFHAIGYTTSTRAGVQAQAAAEAGIDYAAASLATSACQAQYSSATAPRFTVTIASSTLAASPGATDTSWVSGCPTSASVQRVKLVSTGTAGALGVAGNSSGNVRKVEAIYPYVPTPPTWITASGAAIYSYAQSDATINNLTINTSASTPATIQYLSGSASCTSGSTINGNVILGQGGASLASGCTINGDLYASGTIGLQSATVTGNVTAANGTYPSVDLANTATVNGNVYAGGPVRLKGLVGGSVIAGPTAGSSSLSGSVGGSVVAAGTVSNSGTVTGTITPNKAGIVTPAIPYVPGWVDYPYAASDWTTGGFTELVLTNCTSSGFTTAMNTVLASTTPYVLNALACTGGLDFSALASTTTLKSDLAIIATSFNMSGNDFESSSSSSPHRKLWFITPDRGATNNHVPDCPSGGSFTMGNHVTVGTYVDALIYSPCVITNSANVWQGQIYAAGTKTSNAFTLNYVPIGIPGVNLSTGQVTPPSLPGTGTLGSRTSIRNITG
jgi:cytoskeletal protein CcmA (bactofilin family)